MKVSEQFRLIALADGAKERDVHTFLKDYPYVLIHLFNHSWNFYYAFSEFQLGTDFRADFVILSADSGAWHAEFIELEGPHDKPYKKDLTPTPKLNWAIRQTNDWREFTTAYRQTLLHEIAKLLRPLEVISQNNLMTKGVKADIEILHPETYVHFDYHVIIGNSKTFTDAERKAHARFSISDHVMTYDRVYNTMVELESRCSSLEDQKEFLSQKGCRAYTS